MTTLTQHALLSASRRHFLQSMAFGAAAFTTPGLFAEQLAHTPRFTEGPFYPDKLPLDTDNDLLIINDGITPAVGEITHLTGRLLSPSGEPIRNALVEIWQCDNNGAYIHSGSGNRDHRDRNFQGYGRFLTDRNGQYYFRTIKPVPYPGRTPHIHFAVSEKNQRLLTTQMFVKGHPQNDRDGLFQRVDDASRALIAVDFQPIPESNIGELAANFDLVCGLTPEDPAEDEFRGRPPRGPRPRSR
ncbi:MAG: intradiol ring-cleavage dioxygenase [Planctomycetaceae bacterium]|nr:intradiol ring-cleavage dioxygenase [Planctomycetaceae bacterium]